MCEKISYDEFVKRLEVINPEIEVIGKYESIDKKAEFKCKKCNYIWLATGSNVTKNKTGCPNCNGGRRWSKDEIKNRLKEKGFILLGEFVKLSHHKTEMLHEKCGNIIHSDISRILCRDSKFCNKCSVNKKLDYKEFIDRVNNRCSGLITPIGEYKSISSKMEFKCNKCNTIFKCPVYSLLKSGGKCCPTCSKRKMDNDKFLKYSKEKWNGEIVSMEEYKNSHTKIQFKHILCGSVFTASPTNHLSGKGCPFCSHKTSKMEEKIEQFLKEQNILYERQKDFDGCRYKKNLKFDFYLNELNILLEYDGEQHFIESSWYEDRKAGLETIKIRDSIKTKWCQENNIKLIRISYLEKDRYREILCRELSLTNDITESSL